MASFTGTFFFVTIILSTLLLSTQIHARDSYLFGKFKRDSAQDKNPSFVPVATNQKSSVEVLPKREQEQQDQDPGFVPESDKGYGLYGHETTYKDDDSNNNKNQFNKQYEENVSYEPYNTPSLSQTEESYNSDKYSKNSENYDNGYNNYDNNYDKNNNNNNNDKNYNNNDKNYYNSNAYGRERSSGYNGYNNNVERQGMSDTRFMENGKYYFDVNDDNNHGELYKKHYRHSPSYAVSNYDRFEQNNNERSFYDNNNEQDSFQDPYNSKWEKNMMNEQEQEEEFGNGQQDQFVP